MDDPSAESDILSDISNNAENLEVYTVDIAVSLLESLLEFLEDERVSIVFIIYTMEYLVSAYSQSTHTLGVLLYTNFLQILNNLFDTINNLFDVRADVYEENPKSASR